MKSFFKIVVFCKIVGWIAYVISGLFPIAFLLWLGSDLLLLYAFWLIPESWD